MNFQSNLIKDKSEVHKGNNWYRQRFDGSPYFLHLVGEAGIHTDKDLKENLCLKNNYCFFSEDKADWFFLVEELKNITAKLLEQKNNLELGKELIKKWNSREKDFYNECIKISKINLTKLDEKELLTIHDKFIELILRKHSSTSIIDGFALGSDELFAKKIKLAYENSSLKEKMNFSEVFSKLGAPVFHSYIVKEELNLMKIALKLQGKENIDEELKNHQEKYFWINNNYVDSYILKKDYFKKEVKKLVLLKDLKEQIQKINDFPLINQKNKEEIINELNLDQKSLFLIKFTEDMTFWQDERKKSLLIAVHYGTLILKEISKRTKININLLKYASHNEIKKVFSQELSSSKLSKRRTKCVFYWGEEGYECVTKNVNNIREKLLGKSDEKEVNDFRGLTASTGIARGKVKILTSVKEISKVNKGDVLVAVMTRPDYIPAMRKAAAIITDEGGITCHAAIISRELGIPCIIGTKIATQVLKDGMKVKVDANHGLVSIIK